MTNVVVLAAAKLSNRNNDSLIHARIHVTNATKQYKHKYKYLQRQQPWQQLDTTNRDGTFQFRKLSDRNDQGRAHFRKLSECSIPETQSGCAKRADCEMDYQKGACECLVPECCPSSCDSSSSSSSSSSSCPSSSECSIPDSLSKCALQSGCKIEGEYCECLVPECCPEGEEEYEETDGIHWLAYPVVICSCICFCINVCLYLRYKMLIHSVWKHFRQTGGKFPSQSLPAAGIQKIVGYLVPLSESVNQIYSSIEHQDYQDCCYRIIKHEKWEGDQEGGGSWVTTTTQEETVPCVLANSSENGLLHKEDCAVRVDCKQLHFTSDELTSITIEEPNTSRRKIVRFVPIGKKFAVIGIIEQTSSNSGGRPQKKISPVSNSKTTTIDDNQNNKVARALLKAIGKSRILCSNNFKEMNLAPGFESASCFPGKYKSQAVVHPIRAAQPVQPEPFQPVQPLDRYNRKSVQPVEPGKKAHALDRYNRKSVQPVGPEKTAHALDRYNRNTAQKNVKKETDKDTKQTKQESIKVTNVKAFLKRLLDQVEKNETETLTQLQLTNIKARIISAADFKDNTEVEMSMRTLSKADNIHPKIRKWATKIVNFWDDITVSNNGQKLLWAGNKLKLMRVYSKRGQ